MWVKASQREKDKKQKDIVKNVIDPKDKVIKCFFYYYCLTFRLSFMPLFLAVERLYAA